MPSLPPKCSYTTGLDTSARAAISSTLVPSKPFSANRRRDTSSSWARRCVPVIRERGARLLSVATGPSCRSRAFAPGRLGGHGAPRAGPPWCNGSTPAFGAVQSRFESWGRSGRGGTVRIMATTRGRGAPFLLLGILVFVVISQVVDLAVGAPEVGVRVGVLIAAAVGAVLTGVWIARRK